ncbi:MAG: hypothetical protein MMC23_008631 [Stictis urceolatum]|nr:hypothetical protein [Stictis urceolata]
MKSTFLFAAVAAAASTAPESQSPHVKLPHDFTFAEPLPFSVEEALISASVSVGFSTGTAFITLPAIVTGVPSTTTTVPPILATSSDVVAAQIQKLINEVTAIANLLSPLVGAKAVFGVASRSPNNAKQIEHLQRLEQQIQQLQALHGQIRRIQASNLEQDKVMEELHRERAQAQQAAARAQQQQIHTGESIISEPTERARTRHNMSL